MYFTGILFNQSTQSSSCWKVDSYNICELYILYVLFYKYTQGLFAFKSQLKSYCSPPLCYLISVEIQLFCEGFKGFLEKMWLNNFMKTKVHSRKVRDKVVENVKAELGYKIICCALHIPWGTFQFLTWKWKYHGKPLDLQRRGSPP